jgi:hypothetical protein
LVHDAGAIEQVGREICPVALATLGLQEGGVATAWMGILAGISSPFQNNGQMAILFRKEGDEDLDD